MQQRPVNKRSLHRFQPAPEQAKEVVDPWNIQFPTDATWAIYARQSTPAQVLKHIESNEMQTEDLRQWLVKRNVPEAHTALYDADLGVSGAKRIDERIDLQRLVRDILAEKIKAVLVYQISRLFRDLSAVQYNMFADYCKQHNVLLVTAQNGMILNFNNYAHLQLYRMLAEQAAQYLTQQIGFLIEMRMRKALKGLYAGFGPVPMGYIVDYRHDSPTHGRYIAYRPHAEQIFYLFKRFYMLQGNISALVRELESMPVLFPEYESWVDPRNIARKNRKAVLGGYHISYAGLIRLMANPTYLGWWIVKGDIISRENHEPIIDAEHEYLFWYAFERLAPYTIDKQPNENRSTYASNKRYYQRDTEPVGGLLKDRIEAENANVHVHITNGIAHYTLIPKDYTVRRIELGEIKAEWIDDAFSTLFLQKLSQTHDLDDYHRYIQEEANRQEQDKALLQNQLTQIANHQEAAFTKVLDYQTQINTAETQEKKDKLTKELTPLITISEKRIATLEASKGALTVKLTELEQNTQIAEATSFADFQTEVQNLIPVWDKKPVRVRQVFINMFVQKAVVASASHHWLLLDVYWSHPNWLPERLIIYRPRGANPSWTEDEQALLQIHYATASKVEIMQYLLDKTWASIMMEARSLGLERNVSSIPFHYSKHLSWSDVQFMQAYGIEADDKTTKYLPLSQQSSRD